MTKRNPSTKPFGETLCRVVSSDNEFRRPPMSFFGFMFRRLWCFAGVLSSAEVCLLIIAERKTSDVGGLGF
ncbi:hypothetical protein HanIR_Chr02g0066061 [Helianthus annuus]|nr:hypothetical protein HanIR_Chr02g0066061 [Helianthus annuus]